jgi:nitrogen fixation protein NifU and related proteins
MSNFQTNRNNFNFWQNHSLHYLEMAFRSDKRETIDHPDGYGKRTGQCGDTVEMFLTVRNKKIASVSFQTDGCINTHACSNTLAFLAEGITIAQAWEITPEDVIDYLGTLPAEETHCAEVAVGALYLALADLRELEHSPWKKAYR